jgi:hypothetical protein
MQATLSRALPKKRGRSNIAVEPPLLRGIPLGFEFVVTFFRHYSWRVVRALASVVALVLAAAWALASVVALVLAVAWALASAAGLLVGVLPLAASGLLVGVLPLAASGLLVGVLPLAASGLLVGVFQFQSRCRGQSQFRS